MEVLSIASYVPQNRVTNDHFSELLGKSVDWFEKRTGIRERSRAGPSENSNTMAVQAAVRVLNEPGSSDVEPDLIVSATYTPWDLVYTPAHAVQRELQIENARVLNVTNACSSFLSALEIVRAMLSSGQSETALIVAVEHNSHYSDDEDLGSGHLWGDGASALILTRCRNQNSRYRVLDVVTKGLAGVGRANEAVNLCPSSSGLTMSDGRDVFQNAVSHMSLEIAETLSRNGLTKEDVGWVVAHQANSRILGAVLSKCGIPKEKSLETIHELGNTGSASIPITLNRHVEKLSQNAFVVLVSFGGGYSSGAALLRVN